jgi:5'-nucleotidase
MVQPLILVTNDDGIGSDGLWASVEALLPLGQVVVVAPDRQWSGGGRSMPPHVSGRYEAFTREVDGVPVSAYAVDASPALAVQHGILEFAPREPSLVVSGINYGLNLTTEVTISGTVGAALEASAFGVPALAPSLQMAPEYHLTGDSAADYTTAQAYAQRFAWYLMVYTQTHDVDVLSINVPASATPDTPWRLTRLSRHRYFQPLRPDRANGRGRPGYVVQDNMDQVEIDSDLWAVHVDGIVSVTPLSLDVTSRIDLCDTDQVLQSEVMSCQDTLNILSLFRAQQDASEAMSYPL